MTDSQAVREAATHPTSTPATRFPAFTATAWRRRWREFLYAVLGLPVGVATFSFAVSALSLSAGLLVTIVGLPLLAATGLASRWIGSRLRALANTMLDADVAPATPFRPKPGPLGWLRSCLTDGTAWRAHLYLLLKLPVGISAFTATVTLYTSGLAGATYWMWRPFVGCDSGAAGTCHPDATFGGHHLDTPLGIVVVSVAGIVLLCVTPWLIRRLLALDTFLVRALLGPAAAR